MSEYNAQLHLVKDWQVTGFATLSFVVFTGSLFAPIKPGQIPIARIAAIVLSGASLHASKLVHDSKQILDAQKRVIASCETKVFVHNQSVSAAREIEELRIKHEDALAKTIGVPKDAEYN